jgi:hypothetical protein
LNRKLIVGAKTRANLADSEIADADGRKVCLFVCFVLLGNRKCRIVVKK